MMIHVTLQEGGRWWHIDIHNIDNLKSILNTGRWHETKVYAVMIHQQAQPMIFDCILKQWR